MLYHLFQHLLIIKIHVLSKNDRSRNLEQSIDPTVSRSISLTLHPTFSLMWALLPIHTHVHGTCTWASCFVSLRYIVFLFRIKIYVLLICLECFYKYICLFIVAWQIEIDIFSLYINPELIYPTNYFLNLSWASLPVFVSPGLSLSI